MAAGDTLGSVVHRSGASLEKTLVVFFKEPLRWILDVSTQNHHHTLISRDASDRSLVVTGAGQDGCRACLRWSLLMHRRTGSFDCVR